LSQKKKREKHSSYFGKGKKGRKRGRRVRPSRLPLGEKKRRKKRFFLLHG